MLLPCVETINYRHDEVFKPRETLYKHYYRKNCRKEFTVMSNASGPGFDSLFKAGLR